MRKDKSDKGPSKTTFKLVKTKVIGDVARQRLGYFLGFGLLFVVAGFVFWFACKKDEKQQAVQVGQHLDRQRECYADADCPDGTFCSPPGLCTGSLVPGPRPSAPVLGRGRAGEGDMIRATFKKQGE